MVTIIDRIYEATYLILHHQIYGCSLPLCTSSSSVSVTAYITPLLTSRLANLWKLSPVLYSYRPLALRAPTWEGLASQTKTLHPRKLNRILRQWKMNFSKVKCVNWSVNHVYYMDICVIARICVQRYWGGIKATSNWCYAVTSVHVQCCHSAWSPQPTSSIAHCSFKVHECRMWNVSKMYGTWHRKLNFFRKLPHG